MMLGKLDIHMQKNETRPLSCTTHNNLKWIKAFSVRPKIVKLLEENTEGKLLDMSLSDDFLHLTAKAQAVRAKIKK